MDVDMVVVIISLDEHLVSSDGSVLLDNGMGFFWCSTKRKEKQSFNFFPYNLMFISLLCFPCCNVSLSAV